MLTTLACAVLGDSLRDTARSYSAAALRFQRLPPEANFSVANSNCHDRTPFQTRLLVFSSYIPRSRCEKDHFQEVFHASRLTFRYARCVMHPAMCAYIAGCAAPAATPSQPQPPRLRRPQRRLHLRPTSKRILRLCRPTLPPLHLAWSIRAASNSGLMARSMLLKRAAAAPPKVWGTAKTIPRCSCPIILA